jgi:uncharacterized membrane protein
MRRIHTPEVEATMVQFSESVLVDRPVDVVFDYVATIDRWTEWRLTLTAASVTPPGPLASGSTIHATGQAMGRALDMEMGVTAFEPGQRIAFTSRSGPITLDGEFRFAPEGAGTRLTIGGTAEPGGLMKIAGPLVARQIHEMWSNDFAALKAILED